MDKQTIGIFRSITQDFTINDTEIVKFLKWGNNDIQQALNYYYRKIQKDNNQSKEKTFFKTTKKTQIIFSKVQTSQKEKMQESKNQEESFQEVSVFDKMKKASIKQKKTEEFIARVRREYQLPIGTRRNQNQSNQNSNQTQKKQKKQIPDDYQVQQEFKCADYLGSVFNNNLEISDQQQNSDIDEFNQEFISEQLKDKLKVIQIQTKNIAEIQKKNKKPLPKLQFQKLKSKPSFSQNEQKQEQKRPMTRFNGKPQKSYPKFQYTDSPEKMQIQKQKIQQIPKKSQSQNKISVPNQVYIGQYFFQGFKTDTKPFPQGLEEGTLVEYRYYIQPQKKKKAFKPSKGVDKSINMRLCFGQNQFCRVQDHQARIFVPLITQNIIKIQVFLFQLPHIINIFAKVKFRAKVFLKKKAITDPVVETFDGQSEYIVNIYKGIRQEIAGLLERVNLQIKSYPLIKNKSKFSKNLQNSKKLTKSGAEFQKKAIEFQIKQKQYNERKKSDPFLKIKQVNIKDMMKNNNANSSSQSKNFQIQSTPVKQMPRNAENHSESQIKKKIIELNNIQDNKYAQLIDLYEQDIQPIYPKANFKSELYHYQAVALAWMLKRQGRVQIENFQIKAETEQIHPLWTEYALPTEDYEPQRSLFYNELTAQTSLIKPVMKTKCKGGILADEMGLGKTVMMAALISSSTEKNLKKNQAQNLVIVPLTLLSQWQSQIKKHTKNVSVVCYYTAERHKIIDQLGRYNVVITTYGTVSHQFTKMSKINKIGLYKYKWKRIILDEAHYIKGRIIQTSKAVYNLEGQCRWCLTGTPIQNGLNDLFSLVHFIKYAPWSEFQCWSKYIMRPHQGGDQSVYEVLRSLLKRVFLRRTKTSKDHQGKNIIELPKRHSKIQVLEMSPKQREFYDTVYDSTKAKLDELDKLGIITAKYMQVLQILVRLRQVCCHPLLFKSITKYIKNPQNFQNQLRKFIKKRQSIQPSGQDESQNYYEPLMQGEEQIRVQISQQNKKVSENFLKDTIQKISKDQIQNCLICLNNVEEPVITSCLHIFCKTCMIRQIQELESCATCRKKLTKDDFLHLPRQNRFNFNLDSEKYTRSTKMIALMEHLKKMNHDDKAVVFSQFLGMMDLLEHDFIKNNIKFVRMQGSTPQKERAKIISQFSNNPQVKIFLVSLKTAGVGLNLVAANKVFLMDPWWNPGVEDQAIQRVHRIGQKKQVQIVRFIMDKTIEMRMLQLNTQKKNLSQLVLSHKDNQNESKIDKLRYLMEKY